ncbi:MAG: hypothetical protein DMF09_12465, partial [Verrucomicrobia bacterium]
MKISNSQRSVFNSESFVFAAIATCFLTGISRAEQPLADSAIVVYNKAVPESVELAKFYAEKRGIAPDHLIGLDCSTEEEITREQYDATIAGPLRDVFSQRHWWAVNESPGKPPVVTASSVHFVAIIKGVPL